MKKLPIGISEFKEMIKENYYYVDKSLLIKDIVDLPGKVKLITRPRRFGKTLNLKMIENFFSMNENENLFENLKIWKEKYIVDKFFHSYPVIFVTFKDIKETNWDNALSKFKRTISNVSKKYIEYAENRIDKKFLENIWEIKANQSDYEDALRFLTEILYKKTGKKVILLIDEYDVPIEAAYLNRKKDEEYYEKMISFIRGLLTSALKDNEYLEMGILTGVYRVAKESIFSGLNNLEVFTVFDSAMENKFGFTEDEVKQMIKYYSLSDSEIYYIKEWYDNFRIGDKTDIYNPWSVIKYINERVIRKQSMEKSLIPYWINTSSNDIIEEQIKNNPYLKEEIDKLLQGKRILKKFNPWLSLREMETIPSGIWTLLVSSGYLNAEYSERLFYIISIPNNEINFFFKNKISEWFEQKLDFPSEDLYKCLKILIKDGKTMEFKNLLKRFIENSLSYYDLGFKEPERVYKAFLLGILSIAINGFEVESEMESGYGRLDVVLYPKTKKYGKYAVIFEVKKVEKENELENTAKKALYQIKKMKYYKKMKDKGYDIIAFGIAFSGKKVSITDEIL